MCMWPLNFIGVAAMLRTRWWNQVYQCLKMAVMCNKYKTISSYSACPHCPCGVPMHLHNWLERWTYPKTNILAFLTFTMSGHWEIRKSARLKSGTGALIRLFFKSTLCVFAHVWACEQIQHVQHAQAFPAVVATLESSFPRCWAHF